MIRISAWVSVTWVRNGISRRWSMSLFSATRALGPSFMALSRRHDVGLAHRRGARLLRPHFLHEQLHRAPALLAGRPVLARHDQERPEAARGLVELAQLARDRVRIAPAIEPGLGQLIEGHLIALELQVVVGPEHLDQAALRLEAELVSDVGAQIIHGLAPGIREIDVARGSDVSERLRSARGLGGAGVAVGFAPEECRRLELCRK